jgi:hypothetical protein
MTKSCTLKEAFIERQLDKFQPDWRSGEDITAETKQKIKDYVTSQMPDELKESADCINDYSIWHMAKKIRTRENLPEPKKSNKEKKVSVCKSSQTSDNSLKALQDEKQEAKALSFDDVVEKLMEIITLSSLITVKSAIEAIEHDEGLRTQN